LGKTNQGVKGRREDREEEPFSLFIISSSFACLQIHQKKSLLRETQRSKKSQAQPKKKKKKSWNKLKEAFL
jgi:hypothetical protein